MNIAFIVLIILVLMIGAVLLWYPDNSAGLTKKDVFGSALGLCTLILGYLFGRGR